MAEKNAKLADQTSVDPLVSKRQSSREEARKSTLLKMQSNVQSTVKASALSLQQKLQKALIAPSRRL